MGAGRFICVAVPFGLTLCSFILILTSMLAGVTNKNFDMFEINTQNFSISASSLENLAKILTARGTTDLTTAALESAHATTSTSSTNITAADLGLADKYKVNLFNYCYESGTNTTCIKAKFDWAASALNVTAIEKLATSTAGVTVTLPTELKDSLKTFTAVSKWTEVLYNIALVTCVTELFLGLFAICSRASSCVTFLVSGLSTVAIIGASIMATVLSSVTTASVDTTAKAYGVHATINTQYLAITWLAVAFSIASGLFWMFTICCCASDHHKSSSKRGSNYDDQEKLVPAGSYAPIRNSHQGQYPGQETGIYNQQPYSVPMNNVKPMRGNAYEPYSHAAI